MAYSQAPELTPNCPLPHYNYVPPPTHHHHSHPPKPNPNPIPPPLGVPPPAMTANPYAPHGGYALARPQAGPTPAPYYYGAAGSGEAAMIPQHRVDPPVVVYANPHPPLPMVSSGPAKGLGTLASPTAFLGTNPCSCAKSSKNATKNATKVVQSAYCDVCEVNCSCQENLNNHKQGKKHKKNLEKLQVSLKELVAKEAPVAKETPAAPVVKEAPAAPVAKEAPAAPVAKEAPAAADKGKVVVAEVQKKRKEASDAAEELESKKRRLLESGATPDELRVCTICSVVVNSQTVYDSHIVGHKHAAMLKKQEAALR